VEMVTYFHSINISSNVPFDRTSPMCSAIVLIYSAVGSTAEHCRVLLHLPMYISLIGLYVMWKNVSSNNLHILMSCMKCVQCQI